MPPSNQESLDIIEPTRPCNANKRQRLNGPMKTKGRATRLANHTSGFYYSMEFPSSQTGPDIHTIHSTFPRRVPPQIQHCANGTGIGTSSSNDSLDVPTSAVPITSSGSNFPAHPQSHASPPRNLTIQAPSRPCSRGNGIIDQASCSSEPSSDSQARAQPQPSPQSVAIPSQSHKDAESVSAQVNGIVSRSTTVSVINGKDPNVSSTISISIDHHHDDNHDSHNIVPLPTHSQQAKVHISSIPDCTTSMNVDTAIPINVNVKRSNLVKGSKSSSGSVHPKPKASIIRNSDQHKKTQLQNSRLQYNMAYMPKKVKVERVYDMNLVPKVKKSSKFLERWRRLSEAEQKSLSIGPDLSQLPLQSSFPCPGSLPSLVPCDASASASEHSEEGEGSFEASSHCDAKSTSSVSECSSDKGPHPSGSLYKPCHACLHPSDLCPDDTISATGTNSTTTSTSFIPPFAPDCESVIWVPKTRTDWEDSIDEMVAVCTAAEWHKHKAKTRIGKKKLDFHPPISRIYIRDRIDIDDPLRGYQIRHKHGGWLQGFVMMTTFTTWTHYFKWDSSHRVNGIDHNNPKGKVDDCTLSEELERQTRSGNPLTEGVVWPSIAEMSLVGALGCGEYLLQMAMDDISRRGSYDYVVLEATESARPFYEKFGFVRVGAVCKYGNEKDVVSENGEVQIVGYRHWTYANESEQRVDAHGAPSCMMARRVRRRSPESLGAHCQSCGKRTKPSFVDELSRYFVCEKPKIEPLNSSPPGRKRSMSGSVGVADKMPAAKRVKTTVKQKRVTTSTSSGRTSRAPSRLDEYDKSTKFRSRSNSNTNTTSRQKPCSISTSGRSGATRIPANVENSNSILTQPRGKKDTSGSNNNLKPIPLRKQKIPTMYRSPKKQYFYNKVVTPKKGENTEGHTSRFYFVIHYDADTMKLRLIPLFLRGKFKGKREGRPKWKADVLDRGEEDELAYLKSMNVLFTSCSKWDIVPSFAVTKCASVKQESWDIVC